LFQDVATHSGARVETGVSVDGVLRHPSGRVVGGDLYYDQVSLLTQLGLMPQPS